MARHRFAIALFMMTALLAWGCDKDPSSALVGSWRAETVTDLDGKPIVITLTDKKLKLQDLDETSIEYEVDGDRINIKNAAYGHIMIVASEVQKNSVVFDQGSTGGKDSFTRISAEEAKVILQGQAEAGRKTVWR